MKWKAEQMEELKWKEAEQQRLALDRLKAKQPSPEQELISTKTPSPYKEAVSPIETSRNNSLPDVVYVTQPQFTHQQSAPT